MRQWQVMGAELVVDPTERHGRLSRRTELTLFLVPMALAFSLAQVSKMFWPTLLAEAPWTLLVMSVNTTRALLVQPLVHPAVFFSLAIARPLVMAPVYYLFGRRYGDVGIRWMKSKLAPESTVMPRLERFFRRFIYPLVAWSPTMLNSTVAGATGMPAVAFFALAIVGTVARVTLIYFLGDVLSAPLKEFASFVGQYQWYITPVTFALGAYFLWRMWRKNRRFPLESVDEFDAELRETALELQSEATVTSPPEPD
jgi:membrane protein DedA with SNARE-associated domain